MMLKATDSKHAPWRILRSDDKKRARLNIITHLLSKIPHKRIPGQKIQLPERQKAGGYKESKYPYKFVEQRY
jgi:hypothetical protein